MSDVGEIVEEDDIRSVNNLGDVGNIQVELDYNGDIIVSKELLTNTFTNSVTTKITVKNNEDELYTYIQIGKFNIKKLFIGNLLVDIDSYEKMRKYNWSVTVRKQVNGLYYNVHGKVDGKDTALTHFLCGKPKKGHVIDHIDNNGLNNLDNNLHEITFKGNSQNKKKIITDKSTSQYLGVHLKKSSKKWQAVSGGINLGIFEIENDAAIQYDKYTLLTIGKNASTNNLVKYEDIINLKAEDLLPKKEERKLPKNISEPEIGKFHVRIGYKKKTYSSKYYNTLDEALKKLDEFKNIIKLIKEEENKKHSEKEITRNKEGFAIINIYNTENKELKGYTIVDDDKWYELSKYAIHYNKDYINISIKKKSIGLHRYLMGDPKDMIVDHINNNPEDNRVINLRISIDNQNTYNTAKRENCSSIYKGVWYREKKISKNNFHAGIAKDNKNYTLGCYEIEIQAAIAYNLMATVLFKEFANINILDIDTELYNKYKNEILTKWKTMPRLHKILNI